jgi:hypothetical protein
VSHNGRAHRPVKRIKVFCFFFSKKKRLFFFEKKNQKTYIRFLDPARTLALPPGPGLR